MAIQADKVYQLIIQIKPIIFKFSSTEAEAYAFICIYIEIILN